MASKLKLVKGDPFSFVARLTKNTTITENFNNWDADIELRKGSTRADELVVSITSSVVSGDLLVTIPDTSTIPAGYYVLHIKLSKGVPSTILRRSVPLIVVDTE